MKRILLVAVASGALFLGAAQPASAQLEEIIDLLGIADTSIGMNDVPGQVVVGEDFDYRVNVRNNGLSKANGVLVQTRLAASLEFVGASGEVLSENGDAPDVECKTPSARVVNCRLETLDAGTRAQVLITVTPTAIGFPQSRASVESNDIDLRAANNSAQEGTIVKDNGAEEEPAETENDAQEETVVR